MTDQDFKVLQTALSPEVSESEEQVCGFNIVNGGDWS